MPARFPTQGEIEAKRSDLLKKIAVGKQAEQDLARLEESVKAIAALMGSDKSDDGAGRVDIVDTILALPGVVRRPKRVFSPLANIAEIAIRNNGSMHIDLLMAKMKELGWVSADDYRLNMKNVFNTLSANKKFKNLGRNVWDLAENVQQKKENK